MSTVSLLIVRQDKKTIHLGKDKGRWIRLEHRSTAAFSTDHPHHANLVGYVYKYLSD